MVVVKKICFIPSGSAPATHQGKRQFKLRGSKKKNVGVRIRKQRKTTQAAILYGQVGGALERSLIVLNHVNPSVDITDRRRARRNNNKKGYGAQ